MNRCARPSRARCGPLRWRHSPPGRESRWRGWAKTRYPWARWNWRGCLGSSISLRLVAVPATLRVVGQMSLRDATSQRLVRTTASRRLTLLLFYSLRRLRFGLTSPAWQPIIGGMNQWITDYIKAQKAAHDSIPVKAVAQFIEMLRVALHEDRQIFVFGNGGSAANASHFATDLGKSASDKVGKRFRVRSLNDNVSWLLALGNDYSFEDVFVGQLQNYGQPGDLAISLIVSGDSPN